MATMLQVRVLDPKSDEKQLATIMQSAFSVGRQGLFKGAVPDPDEPLTVGEAYIVLVGEKQTASVVFDLFDTDKNKRATVYLSMFYKEYICINEQGRREVRTNGGTFITDVVNKLANADTFGSALETFNNAFKGKTIKVKTETVFCHGQYGDYPRTLYTFDLV